ncbi:MAG: glycoside hydrolase [Clostridium sp.]|uniref:glycoside hydrolase n=1 Tax=Clostridium TaxID=1485 RepID=UPI0028FDFBED|nr:glycoside hydrolase [Clostridium sp.]MDU1279727.1 glycoside hydrolase [Clostridium sp.]MDU7088944.1 glycoside hydrolase [Clostridium sp.]MDU7949381.1 glycoside hydrolase [Clostridium sp.]
MKTKRFSPKKKDRIKIIRGTLQGIVLLVLLIVILKAVFTFSQYKPYDYNDLTSNEDNGFIAVSYFGVDRAGSDTLISTESLEKQLKALKDNGYVTITQQDILDYYNEGKELPDKALFLLYEDGRRDTAIFAQKIMEKYNYKATMLTYADKFEKNDPKFLMPEDLTELLDSSYWELGTNGYRLEYINVFDKENKYLGQLSSTEFSKLSDTINRNYNHYLMDFIRDEYNIPLETYSEMEERINSDYEELSEIYTRELGSVPILYSLMHSNTGQFGTNDKVSSINGKWIKDLFSMNFNREGYSLNTRESSIYDLTRIQPQSYWSTNHLLMRIWDDTKGEMNFVVGDEEKSRDFQEVKGQAEFIDDTIILTSLPKDKGLIKLLNSDNYKDIKISTELNGNIIGSQAIYFRASDDLKDSLCVKLINNNINIIETINGDEEILYSLDLNNGKDINEVDIKESDSKKIEININDNKLNLTLDGKIIVEGLEVKNTNKGGIYLEATWGEYGYSQRNIADDVYDGVFKKFKVSEINDTILYDSSLKGFDLIRYNLRNYFNKVINWFIKYL